MDENVASRTARYAFAAARLLLGWILLWAFLDKLFDLGHETAAKSAWINGGSPTMGFLKFGTKGPLSGFYQSIAGAAWAGWLFMIGLLGIGLAPITGVGLRVAAAAGSVLFLMMWSAALPPENNIFTEDHLIYAALLIALAAVGAGDTLGLGRRSAQTSLVAKAGWLK